MATADRLKAEALMDVSRETLAKLTIFEARLRVWQNIKNLVAPSTLNQIWWRHFADSHQLIAHAVNARTWVDLGSGAGFPGLVLAIALSDTGSRVHLVESDHRKCAFLRDVARETGAPAVIHNLRIEHSFAAVGPVDIVTARALAPMEHLIGLAHPFLDSGATGLFLKGQDIDTELTSTTISGSFSVDLLASKVDPNGWVVRIRPGAAMAG